MKEQLCKALFLYTKKKSADLRGQILWIFYGMIFLSCLTHYVLMCTRCSDLCLISQLCVSILLSRHHHWAFFFLLLLSQSSQVHLPFSLKLNFPNILQCVLIWIFSLVFPSLSCVLPLGSRATVFWDHMTISQSRPPPLPMCSSPHDVASPAQSRPAHWVPPALPRPPWRTKASQTSQIHPGLKVHPSHETNQQKSHTASLAKIRHLLRTRRRQRPALLTLHCPVCHPRWPTFSFGWKRPISWLAKARAVKAILFPAFLSSFSTKTIKTVGWWWLDILKTTTTTTKTIKKTTQQRWGFGDRRKSRAQVNCPQDHFVTLRMIK